MQPTPPRLTASDLRRMPPAERDAVLEAAAELAEEDYRLNAELTDFEAYEVEEQAEAGPALE